MKIRHAEVIALLKRDGWCPGDVISLDGDDAAPNGDLWLISSAPRPQAKQATSPAIAWFRELAQLAALKKKMPSPSLVAQAIFGLDNSNIESSYDEEYKKPSRRNKRTRR